MEKAIYGLAMPFNDSYMDYDFLTNTWIYEKTNQKSIVLDSVVGATFAHDYTKELGRTDKGTLSLVVNDRGLFFKIKPVSTLAFQMYKKVKNGAIKHCSVSYAVKKKQRDYEAEQQARALCNLIRFGSNVVVNEYKKLLVFEVSIGNNPANEATFCTTDANHPLLKGVRWDEFN